MSFAKRSIRRWVFTVSECTYPYDGFGDLSYSGVGTELCCISGGKERNLDSTTLEAKDSLSGPLEEQ